MQCRTHLVTSCCVNLFLFNPTTISLLGITVGASSLGGVISDIDSRKSESKQILNKVNSIVLIITLLIVSITHFKLFDIHKYININYVNYFITFFLLLFISNMGSKTAHRSFTHSILFTVIIYFILSISLPLNFILPFIIGILLHIILDFTNHIGVTVFFPIKKRLCLDLLDSDGLVNNILFYLSIFGICFFIVINFFI